MASHQELEQQIFDLDIRVDKLESPSNKIITKEKINSIISNGEKYQTNFVKTRFGNGIRTGTELLVRIRGAEVVTGKLSYKGKLLMIDQSHAKDEDKDVETINFKLKTGYRMWRKNLTPGTYELHLWFYDEDSGERGLYRDKFEIFA